MSKYITANRGLHALSSIISTITSKYYYDRPSYERYYINIKRESAESALITELFK